MVACGRFAIARVPGTIRRVIAGEEAATPLFLVEIGVFGGGPALRPGGHRAAKEEISTSPRPTFAQAPSGQLGARRSTYRGARWLKSQVRHSGAKNWSGLTLWSIPS